MANKESTHPKILQANSTRFVRIDDLHQYRERPLTMTAWTQTTAEDFGITTTQNNSDFNLPDPAIHGENIGIVLMDRIRALHECLREHTELLRQVHPLGNTANNNNNNEIVQPYFTPTNATQKILYINQAQTNTTDTEQLLPPQILTPPNSILNINTVQQIQTGSVDSVNYKIVTDNKNGNNDEPLEIELANDSNLDISADSDRLQICLDDEQNKRPACETDFSPSSEFLKRRKLSRSDIAAEIGDIFATPNIQAVPKNVKPTEKKRKPALKRRKPASKPRKPKQPKKKIVCKPFIYTPEGKEALVKKLNETNVKKGPETETIMMSIGPNNTMVPVSTFENVDWEEVTHATRDLLVSVFDRVTLATSSMTGKPSPAFVNTSRPIKPALDQNKVEDIVFAVSNKCVRSTEKEVRNSITTKCADENKMLKHRMRNLGIQYDLRIFNGDYDKNYENKENIVPQ